MNATASRTDIHRPSAPEFDPESYVLVGVFDLQIPSRRSQIVNRLKAQGYRAADIHPLGQCSHCGAHLRYTALMIHEPTNTYVWIGEQCLGNRFEDMTRAQFAELRKAARAITERMRITDRIAALVAEYPALGVLTDEAVASAYGSFTASVGWKFRRDGRLSPNQITAVERVVAGAVERAYNEAHRMAAQMIEREQAAPAPSGRVTVTGKVVHTKWQDNDFGGCVKMLVVASSGYKVWITAPDALFENDALAVGTWVQFDAKLSPKSEDPTFAWGSRPTKAKRIEAPKFA